MIIDLPSLGDVEDRISRWRSTLPDFTALLVRYGDQAPALRHLGLILWNDRNFEAASDALLCALALHQDNAAAWRDLAAVYQGASDIGKAEACIRRAIECDPHQSGSWLLLANIARQRDDQDTAETAFRRAIELDRTLAHAHFGLGIIHFDRRRYEEAVGSFRAVIEHDPAQAIAHACLGHGLYATGDFPGSSAAFEKALRLAPLDAASRRKYARARTLDAMIAGDARSALAAYPDLAGEVGEEIDLISRDAFGLLSAYGYSAAAVDVGKIRLADRPDDPIQRYLLDAVSGHHHTIAPADYIQAYFDRFAAEFDHKLVDILDYQVPQRMTALVAAHRSRFAAMLDLGCGTGLAAEHLASFAGILTGVDLSSGMLDEARKRRRYADLVQAEATDYLGRRHAAFDLVFAADLVIYIGDLTRLFEAAALSLRSGGFFALSIETTRLADFVLLSSGRFAHAPDYVERLAAPAFACLERVDTMIRFEAGHPVDGRLFVWQRL